MVLCTAATCNGPATTLVAHNLFFCTRAGSPTCHNSQVREPCVRWYGARIFAKRLPPPTAFPCRCENYVPKLYKNTESSGAKSCARATMSQTVPGSLIARHCWWHFFTAFFSSPASKRTFIYYVSYFSPSLGTSSLSHAAFYPPMIVHGSTSLDVTWESKHHSSSVALAGISVHLLHLKSKLNVKNCYF